MGMNMVYGDKRGNVAFIKTYMPFGDKKSIFGFYTSFN